MADLTRDVSVVNRTFLKVFTSHMSAVWILRFSFKDSFAFSKQKEHSVYN